MMKKKHQKSLTRTFLVSLGIPTVFIPGLVLASILGWDWKNDLPDLVRSGGYKQSEIIFPTEAKVTKILDGDTFEINNGQTVRMIGINAPNRGEKGYLEAKEYLTDLIAGESIRIEYDYYQDDKFGRILAYVWENCTTHLGCNKGERMINWVLLKKNHAEFVTYKDRRKLKYNDFLKETK
jgi:endonuclease YncB( thermonuclease family)